MTSTSKKKNTKEANTSRAIIRADLCLNAFKKIEKVLEDLVKEGKEYGNEHSLVYTVLCSLFRIKFTSTEFAYLVNTFIRHEAENGDTEHMSIMVFNMLKVLDQEVDLKDFEKLKTLVNPKNIMIEPLIRSGDKPADFNKIMYNIRKQFDAAYDNE